MSLNSNQVTFKHERDELEHKNLKKNGLVKLDVSLWTESSFFLNEVAQAVAVLTLLPGRAPFESWLADPLPCPRVLVVFLNLNSQVPE